MVLVVYIIILLALYLAPLTFTCPCIMDRHSLKPRPDIIGRRGAPMVSWCFARPHCLIQLIVQMDDVQLCGENMSLPRPVWCSFTADTLGKKEMMAEMVYVFNQHPMLMDQVIYFYVVFFFTFM